jgi:hypothetical protein
MKFCNKQKECEYAEINTKGYCNWGEKRYGGLRKCVHPIYMDVKVHLCCPYYWREKKSGMEI